MSAFSEPMPQRAFHASAAVLLGVAVIALLPPAKANADSDAVKRAKSWTYQLQGDTSRVKRSNADVAVIDPDHAGSAAKYKTKRNGEEREVLAYISVGEVEEGRRYMNKGGRKYSTGRTQGWKGNYAAKYWEPGWKEIVKRRVKEALDKGYDGVYLDRVDTYESSGSRKRARQEMIELVEEVSRTAKSSKGDAAVIVQNAEELLTSERYVNAIDGVAKEDLYRGINHDGRRNSEGDIAESERYLKRAKAKGKSVMVVEYADGEAGEEAKSRARSKGFVPTTARRELD
ncbi:MAG: endo alpha-1,4 polygalactosaminidase [Hyphomicrobiaceae bacterium]|nr:endo alpha-1,4 polygalactosaminidase [Hyphomicrobiaceae bacterium]